MEWIDLKEKNPKFNEEILVHTSKGNYKIDVAYVMGMFGAYNWRNRDANDEYLFWMNLPKPPKINDI